MPIFPTDHVAKEPTGTPSHNPQRKSRRVWTDNKSASLLQTEKSDLMASKEGALSPDGMAILQRIGADASSSPWERGPESKILHEKFGDKPEEEEDGWFDKASFSHQATATRP